MNNISNDLSSIQEYIDLLDDNDKIILYSEIKDLVSTLELILNNIKITVQKFKLSDDAVLKLNLEKNKELTICKLLFPYYWKLSNQVF